MTLGVGMNLDLDLGRLAPLLAAVARGADTAALRAALGFHNSMVASLKSWARHMGVLVPRGGLTPLGARLLAHDPELRRPVTRLVLYDRLGRSPEAEVWHRLINHVLYEAAVAGRPFDAAGAREAVAHAGVGAASQALKQRDRDVALTLRALTRPQAFGPLGLLSAAGGGRFGVHAPTLPPAFVAYTVLDAWPAGAAHLGFDALERPGALARVCLLDRPALVGALRSAERAGYLRVEEEAGFDRISRADGWTPEAVLEAAYVD